MKLERLLPISSAVNLALICAIGFWFWIGRDRDRAIDAEAHQDSHRQARVGCGPADGRAVASEGHLELQTHEVDEPFHWQQLESVDYQEYVANLRSIGCPETTLGDIIRADVEELFERRVKELVDTVQDRFWDLMVAKGAFEAMVDEKHEALKALDTEREDVLSALLGKAAAHHDHSQEEQDLKREANRRQLLDFLPPERIAQCLEMEQGFERLRVELREADPPLEEKQLKERLHALESEQAAAFDALLSAEEQAEYRLRSSKTAERRLQMPGADISEEQMRELVRSDPR